MNNKILHVIVHGKFDNRSVTIPRVVAKWFNSNRLNEHQKSSTDQFDRKRYLMLQQKTLSDQTVLTTGHRQLTTVRKQFNQLTTADNQLPHNQY